MNNHYLEILELKPGATQSEIKKAYRRLSKKYHPDLNKNSNAQDKFIELTEAYNFLSSVGPTPHQETVTYDYNPYTDEFAERRKRARQKAKQRAKEEAFRRKATVKSVLRFMDVAAIIALLFNLALGLDTVLPAVEKKSNFANFYEANTNSAGKFTNTQYNQKAVQLEDCDMVFDETIQIRTYDSLIVGVSPILDVPHYLTIYRAQEKNTFPQLYSSIKVFWFFTVICLVLCSSYIISRRAQSKLNIGIYLSFIFIIELFIYSLF